MLDVWYFLKTYLVRKMTRFGAINVLNINLNPFKSLMILDLPKSIQNNDVRNVKYD